MHVIPPAPRRHAAFAGILTLTLALAALPSHADVLRGRFGPVEFEPLPAATEESRERATVIGNVGGWSVSGPNIDFTLTGGSALRATILAPDVVRIRLAPSGAITPNISRAVIGASWPTPDFDVSETATAVTVQTSELTLEVRKQPCGVSFKDDGGSLISQDDPARPMSWDSSYTRVTKSTLSGETYLGLGWRPSGVLKRNGTRFVMRNVPTYADPTVFYGGIPLWYGVRNGAAYGIFFDDASWGEVNAGAESSRYMFFENLGGQVDYFFFYGPDISNILDRYTQLTGRPFLPPKWALGYQQCRWSYTPQSQVLSVANEFRTRSIPCDVVYLDIDYMDSGHAFTFNPSTFPSPAAMLSNLHAQGFHTVANVSPFLFIDDPLFPTASANGYFLKKADGSIQHGWHNYWYFVGGAATGSLAWIDFSKTAARTWWTGRHTTFLNTGIDGVWNDLNEPDDLGGSWPDNVKYDFDGSPADHNKTGNQYCLLQTESSYATLRNHDPTSRPFVLSRGAYAGIQRASAVWSGDNTSDWDNDFTRNIPMGLNISLSGVPWNGHDIGGFFGFPDANDAPSGELYARWIQCGVFSPLCRQHHDGWGNHDPARPYLEPWQFGSTVEGICREAIGLRYRLMPYLYSLAYGAHTSGAPIQRPTVYDFQDDPLTLTHNDTDFMFGPFLLVAPVHVNGQRNRNVYLPAGTDWYDWWTDTRIEGGLIANLPAPLERVPLLARAGAIIPMGPVMQYADESLIEELTLRVYPSTDETSFVLFEDDGISFAYETGGLALTELTGQRVDDEYRLVVGARAGAYTPPARSILAEVRAWDDPVNRVLLNGAALTGYLSLPALRAAGEGFVHDTAEDVVYILFADSAARQEMHINGDHSSVSGLSVY